MTEQEKYIAGQKNCGIEVGDTVRVVRVARDQEAGWLACWRMKADITGVVEDIRGGWGIRIDGWNYPYFVLEIVKKASSTVPDAKPIDKGDSNMSTREQEIFAVVVTENEKVKDDNGQIESIKKKVIFADSALPAYSPDNAHTKAVAEAIKVKGGKAIKDIDEVEVKVTRPFCG